MSAITTSVVSSPQIPGLGLTHQRLLDQLIAQLVAKRGRNKLRRQYYDYKAVLRDLGIAIPPQLKSVETVVGWPAKAVDAMSRRNILDGFTLPEGSTADIGLDYLLEANRIDAEAPQAHTSSLINSPAFVSTTAGDTASGEPEALILASSAENATGLWDRRRRMLSAYLSVVSTDSAGQPDHLVMVLPDTAIIMRRSGTGWDLRESRHTFGYVPVEALPYKPMLDRPFGSSRISRAVMALTDSAVRTLLRTEVSAEFYSAPQRYALGADESTFIDSATGEPIPAWQAIMGRMLAISRDEDGNLPEIGQFAQQTMDPHLSQLRALASQFAGETGLAVGSLGIVQDNPSSAEAIYAAKEDLVVEISHWQRTSLSPAWQRTATNALRITDDSPAARSLYAGIRARWVNPATPSVVSASDAIVKQAAAIPWLADTDVALEALGYDQSQITRMRADQRRNQGRAVVNALIATGTDGDAG